MPNTRKGLWLSCALALVSAGSANAQRIEARAIEVPAVRLQSPSDTTRMRAYYEMVRAANAGRAREARTTNFLALSARQQNDLALALITLLERENAVVASAPRGSLSEDYLSGYYIDLVVTVAKTGDRRALKALLPVITVGYAVTEAIAGAGEPAVGEVVPLLRSDDPLRAAAAAITLGKLAARSSELGLSTGSVATVRGALLQAARGPGSSIVRQNAINGLTPFEGADIRAEMERIATTDMTAISRSPGGPKRFVVREAAEGWLAKHPRR